MLSEYFVPWALRLVLLWTLVGAQGIKTSPALKDIVKRDNRGCTKTCAEKDDMMFIWGNWKDCLTSYEHNPERLYIGDGYDEYKKYHVSRNSYAKCDTRVYVAHKEKINLPWEHYQDVTDCPGGDSICGFNTTKMKEKCVSHALTSTHTAEVTAGFGFADLLTSISAKIGFTASSEFKETGCLQASFNQGCSWESEDRCRSVWESTEVVRVWGYIERWCDYGQRWGGDGDEQQKIFTHDVVFDLPTGSMAVGCDAFCNQKNYIGAERAPALDKDKETRCTVGSPYVTWWRMEEVSSALATASAGLDLSENVTTRWEAAVAYKTWVSAVPETTEAPEVPVEDEEKPETLETPEGDRPEAGKPEVEDEEGSDTTSAGFNGPNISNSNVTIYYARGGFTATSSTFVTSISSDAG